MKMRRMLLAGMVAVAASSFGPAVGTALAQSDRGRDRSEGRRDREERRDERDARRDRDTARNSSDDDNSDDRWSRRREAMQQQLREASDDRDSALENAWERRRKAVEKAGDSQENRQKINRRYRERVQAVLDDYDDARLDSVRELSTDIDADLPGLRKALDDNRDAVAQELMASKGKLTDADILAAFKRLGQRQETAVNRFANHQRQGLHEVQTLRAYDSEDDNAASARRERLASSSNGSFQRQIDRLDKRIEQEKADHQKKMRDLEAARSQAGSAGMGGNAANIGKQIEEEKDRHEKRLKQLQRNRQTLSEDRDD